MAANHVMHMPVFDKEENFMGIISLKDLIDKSKSSKISELSSFFRDFSISENEPIYTLIREVIQNKTTVMPVVSDLGTYSFVSINSVLSLIGTMGAVNLPGGMLVLEMPFINYSLSEIARLAESNNAIIMNIFTALSENGYMVEVYLKFNIIDLTHLIATYERFDYKVKSYFHHSEITDIYKDRYDQLMHFLNI